MSDTGEVTGIGPDVVAQMMKKDFVTTINNPLDGYGKKYGGADPQLIEGDNFRMIISVPEFGANPPKTVRIVPTPQVTPEVAGEVTGEVAGEVDTQVKSFSSCASWRKGHGPDPKRKRNSD